MGKGLWEVRCSIGACTEVLGRLGILQGREVWPEGALQSQCWQQEVELRAQEHCQKVFGVEAVPHLAPTNKKIIELSFVVLESIFLSGNELATIHQYSVM